MVKHCPEMWELPHPWKRFKARLDWALSNLIEVKMSLLIAGRLG